MARQAGRKEPSWTSNWVEPLAIVVDEYCVTTFAEHQPDLATPKALETQSTADPEFTENCENQPWQTQSGHEEPPSEPKRTIESSHAPFTSTLALQEIPDPRSLTLTSIPGRSAQHALDSLEQVTNRLIVLDYSGDALQTAQLRASQPTEKGIWYVKPGEISSTQSPPQQASEIAVEPNGTHAASVASVTSPMLQTSLKTTTIDFGLIERETFTGNAARIGSDCFGAIYVNQTEAGAQGFESDYTAGGLRHVRWTGGTVSERGVWKDGKIVLGDGSEGPLAYSLAYEDIMIPGSLAPSGTAGISRIGLSEALKFAIDTSSSFSMILPTARYAGSPQAAYVDVMSFLNRMFVTKEFNFGQLPESITFDIGNEHYSPESYGQVAAYMLTAIRDFRAWHPETQFKACIQSMQTEADTSALVSAIVSTATRLGSGNILSEVDGVRVHCLNQPLRDVAILESSSSHMIALRPLIDAVVAHHRLQIPSYGAGDLQIDFSAWSVSANDIKSAEKTSAMSISAMISMLTAFAELGVDRSAAWGFAHAEAGDRIFSSISNWTKGDTARSALYEAYIRLAQVLPGMSLVQSPSNDSRSVNSTQTFGFVDDSKAVILITAGDILDSGVRYEIDFANFGPVSSVWADAVDEDRAGQVVIATKDVQLVNGKLVVHLASDYEFVRIVLLRETPGGSDVVALPNPASERISGGGGCDSIIGGAGNDTILASPGQDTLDGGTGIDVLDVTGIGPCKVDFSTGQLTGNGMASTIGGFESLITGPASVTVFGGEASELVVINGAGSLVFSGSGLDSIFGGAGADTLDGGAGSDRIDGGDGDDVVRGGALKGYDNLGGGAGNDSISGGDGNDVLYGGTGNDTLLGEMGADDLRGQDGADVIFGGSGRDSLLGGSGADRLYGGLDRECDEFVFRYTSDSCSQFGLDWIYDFERGVDRINLSEIDAMAGTRAANESFVFSGTTPRAHSVWTAVSTQGFNVLADVDGDARPDFVLWVLGSGVPGVADLVL